jgi:hypothetical protein
MMQNPPQMWCMHWQIKCWIRYKKIKLSMNGLILYTIRTNVNGLDPVYNNNKFLQTYRVGDAVYLGGYRQSRIWHYYEKDTMEQLDARVF